MAPTLTLALPPEPAFAAVARTAAASVAARAGATVDGVEDLRAVAAELFALALTASIDGEAIELVIITEGSDVALSANTAAASRTLPATDSFAWTIVDALASDVSARIDEGPAGPRLVLQASVRLPIPA